MGLVQRVLRAGEGKKIRALEAIVPEINAVEGDVSALSDEALAAKTGEFRQRLERGADLHDLLVEAFAVVREAARRKIGQRHFDVQLMGGAALHFGWVAEMRTGEGKTLVSTLPAYLNALGGKGVHLVTVNDYLASRDAAWMGQIHRFLGLDVGLVVPSRDDAAHKRAQYAADITYGTNNEMGFDYLRDNMAPSAAEQTQRGHNYCIVDEVDSILIDEARTPLIISGRVSEAVALYGQFARIVKGLRRDVDYEVEEDKRNVAVLEPGIEAVEAALGVDNLYDEVSSNLVHQLRAALRAKELFKRDRDYVVADGEVKIVDEFTGRILEGRRWSDGLHQAVEAKEGVAVKEENQTLATVTLQNYFRLYDKLAGMTGTATTEAAEFGNTYKLDVVPIPTHKTTIRDDAADLVYPTEEAKINAVVEDIAERSETGQPVLVGTVSVENSEKVSTALSKRGIKHNVLNAKEHHREAEIITQAGQPSTVTVATNMAGRGVDILLGGNPEGLARRDLLREKLDPDDPDNADALAAALRKHAKTCETQRDEVLALGGLYVLGTERHESRRIDNQLRGRAGRQGDPGESRFYLSLEDELMQRFGSGAVNWILSKAMSPDEPLEMKAVTRAIEKAQSQVEQRNAESRKNVLKYDEVMNQQRKVIYARREQILNGGDLRPLALEQITEASDDIVDDHCGDAPNADWDVDGVISAVGEFWPTQLTADDVVGCGTADDVADMLIEEGEKHFAERETEIGVELMRAAERQVLLQLIDNRWREHLYEMDHLRDGIHLRGIGQKDPVAEWQREGYDMFKSMLSDAYRDFLKYIMRLEAVPAERVAAVRAGSAANGAAVNGAAVNGAAGALGAAIGAPGEAAGEAAAGQRSADGRRAASQNGAPPARAPASAGPQRQPALTYTSADDATPALGGQATQPAASGGATATATKQGRNEPCACGSGRKFKHCHGR